MRTRTIAFSAALLLAVGAPVEASAQSAKLASLFNQANQMNNEEQDMAKELKSKAGDNQALATMADTMRDDHKDNQVALEALASDKHVHFMTQRVLSTLPPADRLFPERPRRSPRRS